MATSSACLPTPTASSSRYTLTAASQLPTPRSPTSFVARTGTRLTLDGDDFKAVGANVYWLGLDENVQPNPAYPSKGRVLEAMAVAAAMGATTIRSQSLGISYGSALSIENALGVFKPEGDPAWDALDFAVFAARQYGLRLILPLTDQYDYYHGGIPTFLRWRNLSSTDYTPFYDLSSPVFSDFELYIRTLLNHTSPYTNLTLAQDPTILAFELGNELGGYFASHYPPSIAWSAAVAGLLKGLAPRTLVVSGRYGVSEEEAGVEEIDILSDHFYPPSLSRLTHSSSLSSSHQKPLLIGEYDWTNRPYLTYRWTWFVLCLPVLLAGLLWMVGRGRGWGPWRVTIRGLGTCGRARRRRRKEERREAEGQELAFTSTGTDSPTRAAATPDDALELDKSFLASHSTSALPILSPTPSLSSTSLPRRSSRSTSSLLDRPLTLRICHISLLLLIVFLPLLAVLCHTYIPTPISTFLSRLTALSSSSSGAPQVAGDLYWSLFGRDDSCCAYVTHEDGYTLHYPSFPSSSSIPPSSKGVLELTKHAWTVRGERPFWLAQGKEVGDVGWEDLPVVGCPQAGVRMGNGTVVGGT
ncbi:Glycoside hydrolase superfamily [Rhodotorula toruloides]|uniref:mannan endo-1,4-beta-mannosidase n=2 Tax=Rhodotorula toruloides TaxID=5286 RepID=A0A2T0AH75_RHOTO|nr:Glycoside hydrolase superfamily [Rhodotorula toruloides]PRQ77345.1 Glycoside hydrolase superfamily [Rhodotorula toruloides]